MKRQLLVAQLAILLEQRAAQHGLRRQTVAARLLHAVPTQIAHHQAQQRTVLVEPLRSGFQLAADLVFREDVKYSGLDDAFLTHCRVPTVAGFASNSMACLQTISETAELDPREIAIQKDISVT